MARTIESPGVQINEIDLSFNTSLPVGTNIYINGFANQGPTLELVNVTSKSELEQIYGAPTTEAERYFYKSCEEVLNSPANLLCNRMPYGSGSGGGFGDNYTGLFYPVSGFDTISLSAEQDSLYADSDKFVVGEPTLLSLTESEYTNIKSGQVNWSNAGTNYTASLTASNANLGNTGFIVLNKTKLSTNDYAEGYYVSIIDSNSANNDGTPLYNSVSSVQTTNTANPLGFYQLAETTLGLPLTGTDTSNQNSLSEQLESGFQYDFSDASYNDSLIFAVFKLRTTGLGNDTDKLYVGYQEKWVASLDENDTNRVNPRTLVQESFFAEKVVNDNSNYIDIVVNPNISEQALWKNESGRIGQVEVQSTAKQAYSLGQFISTRGTNTDKIIGNVPAKLEASFLLAENKDVVDIDLTVEAGLGTIYAYAAAKDNQGAGDGSNPVTFDPAMNVNTEIEALDDPTTGKDSDIANWYQVINNAFTNFVSETRKDCMHIADPLRGILIQGRDYKVIDRKDKNFSQHIYWPMKNLYSESNNNYVATYGQWVKAFDNSSGKFFWAPFSGYQAAIIARMDANAQPWFAPAGLENGIVRNVVEIGVNPTQKQRDLLYRVGINPVVWFPQDAYTVWGQKTLQAKPSAFDRINVRRLFLTLEKATLRLTRYFVMQPNTVFTRTRLVNYLTPIFEIAKQNEGLYDYLIVCDERNNTSTVIDNNELVVDIYIKPVRSAEFILVNFLATRTGADFNEIIN